MKQSKATKSKTTELKYNPYRNLLTKVRLLLNADSRLTAEEIQLHQWMILVQIGGQKVTLGKGGINTMFYQFGEGKRKICDPMDMVNLLKRLAARKYVMYKVSKTAEDAGHLYWSEKTAMKSDPKKGYALYGMRSNETWTMTHKAANTLAGAKWQPVK